MNIIKENLQSIKKNIENAAIRSKRDPKDILLLGVTKTIDIERINELINLGVTDIGENKVQELLHKYEKLGNTPNWHLIGHLQTNKVKYIIDKVKLIHSVDNIKLAEEINKRAKQNNIIINILIEVNIAGEESKKGVNPDNTEKLIEQIVKFDSIRVKGLMTVAPYVENPQNNRVYFKQMHNLFIDIRDKNKDNIDMEFLSMGMTNDYEIAIEEGSNIIRIGTGLFGARNYN